MEAICEAQSKSDASHLLTATLPPYEELICELVVQFDLVIIPILSCTPVIPKQFPKYRRMIEGEVMVNGTPCAVQSANNPTVKKKLDQKHTQRANSESTYPWQELVASPAKKSLPPAAGRITS